MQQGRNPARIIVAKAQVMDEKQAEREAIAARMGFSAYGVTEGDDPLSQALRGLIDNASCHDHQIALLWKAISRRPAVIMLVTAMIPSTLEVTMRAPMPPIAARAPSLRFHDAVMRRGR